ncbi:MAG: translocation/assembly module TamB [Bacteroidales bacterium]|nr:translocation/assembly module TamB [Bacteroidales bacterium]
MAQKSKIWKITRSLMLIACLMPLCMAGLATLIFAVGPVQSYVCSQVSGLISSKMGTEVRVGGIRLNPFTKTVGLEGVHIEDLTGDTLMRLGSLEAKLQSLSISDNEYELSSLSISTLDVRLMADSNGVFNYQKLLGLEEAEADTSASDTRYRIKIGSISLEDINLAYQTTQGADSSVAMDFGNLRLRNLALAANSLDISSQGTRIRLVIDSLKAQEQCGLMLEKLAAKVDFSDSGLYIKDLELECPETMLTADSVNLVYNGLDKLSYFIDSVSIEAAINEGSHLGLNDLGHFVPDIYGYGISPQIRARVEGPVGNISISPIDIKYGSDTRLLADGYVKGLPDVDNLRFNINLRQMKTCQADLMTLHEPNDSTPLIDIPNIINEIGTLNLTAKAKGTSQNCQMEGTLESKLGNADTRMHFRQNGNTGQLTGYLDASALNLGAISGDQQTLGLLSTHDSVCVNFMPDGNISGHVEGQVDSIGLMGYYYKRISIDGDFTKQSFDGFLTVKDPCLDLDFDGIIDIGDKSQYKFALEINHADLRATNILSDTVDRLQLGVTANLSANNLDNISGTVQLTNVLKFERNSQTLYLNRLNFKSIVDHYICGLPERTYTLSSDFVDATLSGRTHSNQILEILSNFAYMILPSLDYKGENIFNVKTPPAQPTKLDYDNPEFMRYLGNKFDFKVAFKNMNRLTKFFMPELYVSNNTIIEGGFHTLRKNSWVTFKTDKISYYDYGVDSLRISARLVDDKMDMEVKSDSIILSESLKLKHPHIQVEARNDTINYALVWNNTKDDVMNEGDISGLLVVTPHEQPKHFPVINGKLNESHFYAWNDKWVMPESYQVVDSSSVEIKNFLLEHEGQFFAANGVISENPDDRFTIKSHSFDLSLLNHFLGNNTISGNATGFTSISNLYGNLPLVEMNNTIDTLKVNDVNLGTFMADFSFHPGDSVVAIDFYTLNKMQKKNLHGYGGYNFKTNEVDFSFNIGNMSSKVLRPLFQNYLTVPSTQFLDGLTHVWGPLDNLKVESNLKLKGGYFKIDYLGAKYTIQDALNIEVTNNVIKLDKVKLLSGQTGLAYLEGKIDHNNFDKFKMTVDLQLKNFTLLSTQKTDSSAFWGKAYASGNVKITGDPTHMINIDANVRTDKNTQVFLPLYGASEVSNDFSFVTFKNPADTLDNEFKRQKADLSDIRMNFNLEVTPDAEVQAILDESSGNELIASAAGNLKLDITGSGDFSMYGTLAMQRGEYTFVSGPISKKFEVVKGGTLRWNGDPLDAEVDLQAMYKLRKVNLYNLMVDETYRDKKVPVQCLLKMKGNIMTPEISFGVKLEDNGGVAQGQIDNLDEGNINKQMISLLLLNQFQPLPGLRSSENSMFSDFNAGEIVSNKINSMLSDISDKFDVGVNYQMGDGAATEELDVAVSTQLFDERVAVSTNLGVQGDSKNQTNRNTNGVVGEVEVEVKLNKSGSMKMNVYNKANQDELQESPYKQGISFSYKKEFDSLKELWRSFLGIFRRKEN